MKSRIYNKNLISYDPKVNDTTIIRYGPRFKNIFKSTVINNPKKSLKKAVDNYLAKEKLMIEKIELLK